MKPEDIKVIVSKLALEEKAELCSGLDNWNTKAVERLGISSCRTSDGPHGLRVQDGAVNSFEDDATMPAVCFSAACATASSFDLELIRKMGEELGRECQATGVNVLLGPGINIKRTPLCGRNFEYFSEDPFLSGELGAAFVQGLQSQGVGACVKHFFANNQEYRRMDISAEMDERTLREMYLWAFETVVKKSQPWSIMAAYNKIDGVYATANKKYLTDVLRNEWKYEGLVVSDWGAVHDRVMACEAGCDLTMPAEKTDNLLVQAVNEGRIPESVLDSCCERIISLASKGQELHKDGVTFDYEAGHALAREIAEDSILLLKNNNNILPLEKTESVAFIGGFAASPRYQGMGSSRINSFKVTNALDYAKGLGLSVDFAQGYNEKDGSTDESLIQKAVAVAKACQKAVIFAGLPETMDSEGVDRTHIKLPEGHNRLIEAVCSVQPNTVVILHNGGPVEMPWIDSVSGIVEAYLGGQAIGEAVVDVLFGDINPSGRLAESFPKRLEDNASYLHYPGEGGVVQYNERMFVGYRYYESKCLEVLFPFGHGLSYTSFSFEQLCLSKSEIDETEEITASVLVTNTGDRLGKVVVQFYISPPKGEMLRPIRELKGFAKVELQPKESKTVEVTLNKRAFAFWNTAIQDWCVEGGTYKVQLGESSSVILHEATVEITSKQSVATQEYTDTTPMMVFCKHPLGKQFVEDNLGYMIHGMAQAGFIPKELLGAIGYEYGNKVSLESIEKIERKAGVAEGNQGLMIQSVSMLLNFVPDESKKEFKALLEKMNITQSSM